MCWTRLEMLLLAWRDPVSLCNMPFAIFMPRISFQTHFAQQIGQYQVCQNSLKVEKSASSERKVVGVGAVLCQCRQG